MRSDGRIVDGLIGSVNLSNANLEGVVGLLDSNDRGQLIFWGDVSGKMLGFSR